MTAGARQRLVTRLIFRREAADLKIDDIRDRGSFERWLGRQASFRVSVSIGARAGMRVQPILWTRLEHKKSIIGLTALPFFRLMLVSAGATSKMQSTVQQVADASVQAAYGYAARVHDRAAYSIAYAVDSARRAMSDAHSAAAAAALAAADIAETTRGAVARDTCWRALRADCAAQKTNENIWSVPLWPAPAAFSGEWLSVKSAWEHVGSPWDTFARIYDDFWHGREPDWDYLERIILIAPKIWEAGPEAVAKALEIIDELRRLSALAKAQLNKLRSDQDVQRPGGLAGLGHNNPPESLSEEATGEVLQAGAVAARAVEELADELDKSEPSPVRLDYNSNRLLQALAVIAKYCGHKLDLAVDTLIKWGVPAGGVWLVANYTELTALANGAKALAKLLGN